MIRRDCGTGVRARAMVCIAMVGVLGACGTGPHMPPSPGHTASNGNPTPKAPAPKVEVPVAELLRDTASRYANARTYRDSGRCTNQFTVSGSEFSDTKLFRTAFERNVRFRYDLRHSRAPGADPTELFIAWSMDWKDFAWTWTYKSKSGSETGLKDALARPSALSGGATRVAFPLLTPDSGLEALTSLEAPLDKGREQVGGVDCRKIEGTLPHAQTVTLWIDADHMIRKAYIVQAPDPSLKPEVAGKPAPPQATTTVYTTITIDRPTIDSVIPAWAFEPPAKKP